MKKAGWLFAVLLKANTLATSLVVTCVCFNLLDQPCTKHRPTWGDFFFIYINLKWLKSQNMDKHIDFWSLSCREASTNFIPQAASVTSLIMTRDGWIRTYWNNKSHDVLQWFNRWPQHTSMQAEHMRRCFANPLLPFSSLCQELTMFHINM